VRHPNRRWATVAQSTNQGNRIAIEEMRIETRKKEEKKGEEERRRRRKI
jgi:hypothetical protein